MSFSQVWDLYTLVHYAVFFDDLTAFLYFDSRHFDTEEKAQMWPKNKTVHSI